MVTGLLQKTGGDMTIFGKDHIKNRTDIKTEIGLVPQEIAIYEDLTAYENVEFFAGLYGLRGVDLKEQVKIGRATRLNSSHVAISYAVFCLKKKKQPI